MKKTDIISRAFASLNDMADLWIMFLILAGVNIHLITGNTAATPVFSPEAVRAGEWWRLILHPFVHVSWYHLALDAGAFFMLYAGLGDTRPRFRIFYTGLCAGFSLWFTLWFAPQVETFGLCGLSGIAHGLMAVSALEMMDDSETCTAGMISLAVLCAKVLYETATGRVMLEALYFGMCGTPLTACHAGGVIGGMTAFGLVRFFHTSCRYEFTVR